MTEKIEWYKEVLALEPGSRLFFPLAKMLEKEGCLDEACQVMAVGVSRHEDYLEARLYYIEILGRLDKKEECQRQVAVLGGLLSRYHRFWSAWAQSVSERGNADSALAMRILDGVFRHPALSFVDLLNRGLASIDSEHHSNQNTVGAGEYDGGVKQAAKATLKACPESPGRLVTENLVGSSLPEMKATSDLPVKPGDSVALPLREEQLVHESANKFLPPNELNAGTLVDGGCSLRTKSMAEVLAEQGDYLAAVDIYEEILADTVNPQERVEISDRLDTLKKMLSANGPHQSSGAESLESTAESEIENNTDDNECSGKDKAQLITMLETLAKRVEARAHS